MAPQEPKSAWVRLSKLLFFTACTAWLGLALWNAGKPLPAGMRTTSVTRRIAEGDVELLSPTAAAQRSVALAEHAEQMLIVDHSPLPRALAQVLLDRKHARPHLKVVVVADPRGEVEGGTPLHYLTTLEAAGVIVARVRLLRLRDPNPLYSSLWRLAFAWWDSPFDDPPGVLTLKMRLRQSNEKRDDRRVLVADDGAGGWQSVIGSGAGGPAIAMRGAVARDIAAGELQVAQWSSEDDRLPGPPPAEARGVGSVDARWLTESAVRNALLDALGAVHDGDQVAVLAGSLGDRRIVAALQSAAQRATVRVLLDPADVANRTLAGELQHAAGALDVRWSSEPRNGSMVYVAHDADLWLCLGSTALSRRDIGDFNLAGNVELRLPRRAAAARAAVSSFGAAWNEAAPVERFSETSTLSYWRYRVKEAVGLEGY